MLAPGAFDRYTPYFTAIPNGWKSRRPAHPVYLGIHSTQTATAVMPHSQGSWWLMIGRNDGELYDDVPIDQGAWHIRAADRYRPHWMQASPLNMSDPNWTCRGIELVSSAADQAGPEPYTEWQYRCLREIVLPWIRDNLGEPVAIGHGEVQADRSDPVRFDWGRAGFSPWLADVEGHLWNPAIYPVVIDPNPPPEVLMHLTDDEIKSHIVQYLFDQAGQPFAPFYGIGSAWASEYRQGRYRGAPTSPEIGVDNPADAANSDRIFQAFEFGCVTYQRSTGIFSWAG